MSKDNKKQKGMTKREIIKEISDVTNLKTDAVKNVIDAFTDIFIRESVMTGSFHLSNCFIVETKTRAERVAYNVNKDAYEKFPETKVLSIRLSPKINGFHRWKQRHDYNDKHGLTLEDWQNRKDGEIPTK